MADIDASVAGMTETDAFLAGPARVCTGKVSTAEMDASSRLELPVVSNASFRAASLVYKLA